MTPRSRFAASVKRCVCVCDTGHVGAHVSVGRGARAVAAVAVPRSTRPPPPGAGHRTAAQVDVALRDMQERKAASAAASMSEEDGVSSAAAAAAANAGLTSVDSMSEGLRLRSEMARAVQEERCVTSHTA